MNNSMNRRDFLKGLGGTFGSMLFTGSCIGEKTEIQQQSTGDTIKETIELSKEEQFLKGLQEFLKQESLNTETNEYMKTTKYFDKAIEYINNNAKNYGLPDMNEFRLKNPEENEGIEEMENIEKIGAVPCTKSSILACKLYCIKELGCYIYELGAFLKILKEENKIIDFAEYKPLTHFDPQARGKKNMYYVETFGDNERMGTTLPDGSMIVIKNDLSAEANEIGNSYVTTVHEQIFERKKRDCGGLKGIPVSTLSFNEAFSDCISLQWGVENNDPREVIRLVEYLAVLRSGEGFTKKDSFYTVSIVLIDFALSESFKGESLSQQQKEELSSILEGVFAPLITRNDYEKNIENLSLFLENNQNSNVLKKIVKEFHDNYRKFVDPVVKKKKK